MTSEAGARTERRISTAAAERAARILRLREGWRRHPGVRTGSELTRGERAADAMRNGMGSWAFVFIACAFLAAWMLVNAVIKHASGHTFDPYPFILLNLVLSCVAALQGAILLIAAKRSDQVSSELAQHDYEADCASRELLETLSGNFAALKEQHDAMAAQLTALAAFLDKRLAVDGAAAD